MEKEITIQLISFKDTDIIGGLPEKIVLYDTYLEYKWKFTQKQINPDTNLHEEKSYHGSICVLKKFISTAEAFFSHEHQAYQICCWVNGKDTISPLFKTFEEANKVKKQILNWLLE